MNNQNYITDPKVSKVSQTKYLGILGMLWVTFLLVAVFTAVKTFSIGPFVLNIAILAYPFTYIFSDIFTEVYGYAVSRKIIWTGFTCVIIASTLTYIYSIVPPDASYLDNDSFSLIFKTSPAIAFATLVGFFGGESANSFVVAKLKLLSKGKNIGIRLIASTAVGQFIDNALFFGVAFLVAGAFKPSEIVQLTLNTAIFATLWEILILPLTIKIIAWIKQKEGIDTFDHGTDFNPFKLKN